MQGNTGSPMTVADMVDRRHELKVWPVWFRELREGRKRFEIRQDDRGYRIGDTLDLREWVPPMSYRGAPSVTQYEAHYTGRSLTARVTSILRGGKFGLAEGFVCMSIEVVDHVE